MEKTTVSEDWETIRKLFPARHAIRSNSWAFSMSNRLHGSRISRLLSHSNATQLREFLDDRDPRRLKALRTYAAINLEQTNAAFRLTLIINVSLPLILLTVLSQMFPGIIGQYYASALTLGLGSFFTQMIALILAFILLAIILIYAVASLNQARDIRHLIDLFAAERGVYFGLEDMDDMQSE